MSKTIYHGHFTITRAFKAPPARVFAMFADPEQKVRWFGCGEEFEFYHFEMNFRIGGRDFFRFKHPSLAEEMYNEGFYLDIVPNALIVHAYGMGTAATGRFSASLQTLSFAPEGTGTLLTFDEYGTFFDNPEAAKMREEGTRDLLLEAVARGLGEGVGAVSARASP